MSAGRDASAGPTGEPPADTEAAPRSPDAAGDVQARRYDGRTFSERYNEMRGEYDDNLSFGRVHEPTVVETIASLLELSEHDVFVDLGCGTGQLTFLLQAKRPVRSCICVDPARGLFQYHHRGDVASFYEEGAVAFSQRELVYDKLLFKEAIHFVEEGERPLLFTNVRGRLRGEASRFLIVTRPRASPYPLFARAQAVWAQNQPDHRDLRGELEQAGFVVATESLQLPMQVSAARYDALILKRFVSTLNFFSNDELEEGIAELHQTDYAGHLRDGAVAWTDQFVFLAARVVPRGA
jgi:trans-aconitate methyltransferase